MKIYSIHLEQYVYPSNIVLVGRGAGENIGAKLALRELEDKYDCIEIEIPNRIITLNCSFFIGLFKPSIEKLGGEDAFRKKYRFVGDEYILKDIEAGIKESLRELNMLGHKSL